MKFTSRCVFADPDWRNKVCGTHGFVVDQQHPNKCEPKLHRML
jgi:hypothetical protein